MRIAHTCLPQREVCGRRLLRRRVVRERQRRRDPVGVRGGRRARRRDRLPRGRLHDTPGSKTVKLELSLKITNGARDGRRAGGLTSFCRETRVLFHLH